MFQKLTVRTKLRKLPMLEMDRTLTIPIQLLKMLRNVTAGMEMQLTHKVLKMKKTLTMLWKQERTLVNQLQMSKTLICCSL